MAATIKNQSDTSVTLTISLDQAGLASPLSQTYDRLRSRVKAAGFRPGKAPNAIVERELGANTIQSEVLEEAVRQSYVAAAREHDLPVVGTPEINIAKFVPYTELEYSATVDVMPKIELPDYKNLKLSRPDVKVEDVEIDQVLTDLRRRQAKRQVVTRPAKSGDEVKLDFAGSQNGQPVPGTSATDYTLLLGSGAMIPGFESALEGLAAGQSKTADIKFPQDYNETKLAGQTVQFKLTVKAVTELTLPELDDQFAQNLSQLKTLAELRIDIATTIKADKTAQADRQYEQAVLDQLMSKVKVSVPAQLTEQQLNRLESELSQNLAYQGLDIDKYLTMSKKTHPELRSELKPEAERRVAFALVLTEIAKAEGISVSPAEVKSELARLKSQHSDAAMQSELAGPQAEEEIYNHLMASRTVERLLSYIKPA